MSTTVPSHRLVNVVEVIWSIVIEFDATELHVRLRKISVILSLTTIMLFFVYHVRILSMLPLISIVLEVVTLWRIVVVTLASTEVVLVVLAWRHRSTSRIVHVVSVVVLILILELLLMPLILVVVLHVMIRRFLIPLKLVLHLVSTLFES